MVSHKREDVGPGPGNHTLPSLLISPELGRLSPRWQWGVRNRSSGLGKRADGKAAVATLCKEGKGLAKAFHYLTVSHMSKSSFQLEAKAYHWPDPSQISPATRQTLRPKIVPVLSRLTPSTGGGRWPRVEAQPSLCPAEHLSGALLWVGV